MMLNIIDKLNEMMEPVREWIFKHHDNPIFWLILFIVLMALFLAASSALQKEK